jgi:hypothetical protein
MADEPKAGAAGEFTPEQQIKVDAIVKERLARTKEQFKDYEELKNFKEKAESEKNALTQKQLEEQRNYDEAKKGYEKKIADYDGLIKQKDQSITGLKINHALSGEISKQNGYVEEAMALLNGNAIFDPATGEVKIKGKDSNGIDTMLTVEQGVKQFLEARPHLVKAAGRKGGDTPPAGNSGGGAGTAPDLTALNEEYAKAIQTGNRKRAGELKLQVQAEIQRLKNRS